MIAITTDKTIITPKTIPRTAQSNANYIPNKTTLADKIYFNCIIMFNWSDVDSSWYSRIVLTDSSYDPIYSNLLD